MHLLAERKREWIRHDSLQLKKAEKCMFSAVAPKKFNLSVIKVFMERINSAGAAARAISPYYRLSQMGSALDRSVLALDLVGCIPAVICPVQPGCHSELRFAPANPIC